MKITDIATPGLIALGVAGLAATALLGFAAGAMVARDPESARRAVRRVAREAARGVERATLFASQAREHLGDLWAEAREEAIADMDAADLAEASAAATASASSAKPARKRNAPRRNGAAVAEPDPSEAA